MSSAGYRRLKLKVGPGHDREPLAASREALTALGRGATVELQIDANGSFSSDAVDHVTALADEFDLAAIEQPFEVGDHISAAGLIERLDDLGLATVVVADESVGTMDEAHHVFEAGAMSALSIKPGRVGGMVNALALRDFCTDRGLGATAGGMLEASLGRHLLIALAALDGFTVPGDLSPSSRWLQDDPWPDLHMDTRAGTLVVPSAPGIAPRPDVDRLESLTVRRADVRL